MGETNYAPIAIFIFNRPAHLRRTLDSLARCEGFAHSPVVVFCDGPRREGEHSSVESARAVARESLGTKALFRESSVNKGLANSIIAGVGELLDQYGRVIVVEDDLELAPNFITFMNAALDRYADDEKIFQISGHAFEVPEFEDRDRAVFLPITTTWGWATWKRAWVHFDPAATGWQETVRNPKMRTAFNFGGVYDYTTMLQRQMRSGSDSWGVRWYWNVFCRNGLVCFPPNHS